MGIEHIMEGMGGVPPAGKGYLDSKRKVESKSGEKVDSSKNDQVSISPDAKKLASQDSLVKQVKVLLGQLSDVRQDKIDEASTKMYGGVYDQRETAQKVVESIIDGEGLNAPSADIQSVTETIRQDRVAEADQRVQSGYYDQPSVTQSIVDRLME